MLFNSDSYPASLKVEYPKKLSRLTTFFRIWMVIPILIILTLLSGTGFSGYSSSSWDTSSYSSTDENETVSDQIKAEITNEQFEEDLKASTTGIALGLFMATVLMIVFRQRYPRWWFDFNLELNRFIMRVTAYIFLLTDKYPSTEDEQSVHLDLKYPDAKKDLNRWLPLIKWLLALPHYIILFFLAIGMFFALFIAWFAILITGRYPKGLFDFVVGVLRWSWRVNAYAFLLTTDKYPKFSLE